MEVIEGGGGVIQVILMQLITKGCEGNGNIVIDRGTVEVERNVIIIGVVGGSTAIIIGIQTDADSAVPGSVPLFADPRQSGVPLRPLPVGP